MSWYDENVLSLEKRFAIQRELGYHNTTKWDLITEAYHGKLVETSFGHPCSGCGEMLHTEADFARHFIVPDVRYVNLGFCPKALQ
jgi:hypothetical protein